MTLVLAAVAAAAFLVVAGAPNLVRDGRLQLGSLFPSPGGAPSSGAAARPIPTAAAGGTDNPAATPSPGSTDTATPVPPPLDSGAGGVLTAFGALDGDWNAHHTVDHDFGPPGIAYDADASLPRVNGFAGPRYYSVGHDGGRVLHYVMALRRGSTEVVAKELAARELPSDAQTMWFQVKDSCAQLELRSTVLATILGPVPVAPDQGEVFVQFLTTAADGTASYDPGNITSATFLLGSYPTPASALSC